MARTTNQTSIGGTAVPLFSLGSCKYKNEAGSVPTRITPLRLTAKDLRELDRAGSVLGAETRSDAVRKASRFVIESAVLPGKQAPAKQATAKKTAAKKRPAKQAHAKKATAKKTAR